MKTFPFATLLIALLGLQASSIAAAEVFRIETAVHVYRESDFDEVILPEGAEDGNGVATLSSPASASFDSETLKLDGPSYSWSSGRNPPDRFTLVDTPAIVVATGQPASLLSAAPVQYFEKSATGVLEVRNIAASSPDAPHCRMTFTVRPADAAGGALRLTCELDLATLAAREKLPGVNLDVGKPVLARMQKKIETRVHVGEWSAIIAQSANGGDYGLLMLVRVVPAGTPVAGITQGEGPMNPDELDQFATYYYLNPQPERIDDAIRAFGASGFALDRGSVFIGFFGAVFAANPDRVADWKRTANRQGKEARECLRKALKRNLMKSLLEDDAHSIARNDALWGAFFASGDTAYLHRLVGELKLLDSNYLHEFWAGATAEWSLARNASEHPLVRSTLQSFGADADPRTREIIANVTKADMESLKAEIYDVRKTRKFLITRTGTGDIINNWGTINVGPVGDQSGNPNWGR